jgi:hypothetical protein
MEGLYRKLNYKGQNRIALINCSEEFYNNSVKALPGIQIDTEIDPRYPYEFIVVFAELVTEVEKHAPRALHNLVSDGVLWFAYPKKTSTKSCASDLYRDRGWEVLTEKGFDKVRQVSVDNDWSALRFRNIRFIKSSKK